MTRAGAASRSATVVSLHSASAGPSAPGDTPLPETVVIDTCAMIDLLIDPGARGAAVAERLRGRDLVAPDLMFAEAADVLRRLRVRGLLSDAEASMAYAELRELPIEAWPFETVEQRVWDLRAAMSAYDAVFVALSELLMAPLVTSDARLARAVEALPAARVRRVEVV
jgi:predicted nucleic acid-binding protein